MADPPIDHRAVRRVNLSIPVADESVIQWFDVQENKSVSVRTIIKEYIEKYGYTDAFCRPSTQGPRRGRPPMISGDESVSTQPEPVEVPEQYFELDDAPENVPDAESTPETTPSSSQNDEIQLDENGMPILDY